MLPLIPTPPEIMNAPVFEFVEEVVFCEMILPTTITSFIKVLPIIFTLSFETPKLIFIGEPDVDVKLKNCCVENILPLYKPKL